MSNFFNTTYFTEIFELNLLLSFYYSLNKTYFSFRKDINHKWYTLNFSSDLTDQVIILTSLLKSGFFRRI